LFRGEPVGEVILQKSRWFFEGNIWGREGSEKEGKKSFHRVVFQEKRGKITVVMKKKGAEG